jgi:membrane-associated phospholipid phosphatase
VLRIEAAKVVQLAACFALLIAAPSRAAAQAAPDSWRSDEYYIAHSATSVALFGASALARAVVPHDQPGADFVWFPGDLAVRANRSHQAASISDIALSLAVATPVAVQLGEGVGPRFANAVLVYSETMAENVFLNSIVKLAVRRPRPYSYQSRTPEQAEDDRSDAFVSFYSGHASTAFTAAVAGSYLFAESAPSGASRNVLWATEFALAGATANLRVRAGKHYYSDVIVGSLVGSGLGIVTPLLHGATYKPSSIEVASAAGGLAFGILVSQLIPLGEAPPAATTASWTILPATDGTAAVRLVGVF